MTLCTITRNRAALLPLLAECVAAQAYPADRLEWVVVDDSDVGPEPDLEAARQAGVQVKLVHLEAPQPIGAKRNLCHAHASGEVLVLMDDDDYYPPSRVPEAVAVLMAGEGEVAGCRRMPLLLLPEGSRWLTPSFHPNDATANTLAYKRSYLESGHCFDPEATKTEEVSFLDTFRTPLLPLDPPASLTCIGHGGNTVDKRLWIARNGVQRFEPLGVDAPGFPPEAYLERYRQALGLPRAEPPAATASVEQAEQLQRPWRVAVITPYCGEAPELLKRCHRSVLAQDLACTHFLVADGPGHPEVAGWNCRQILLGVGHGDNGNTPRSIGALAAMNEGFTCIAFLDADNWWSADHLSQAIASQAEGDYGVVFSGRQIVFPDGRRLTELPVEDRTRRHADTSAMVVFEPAFSSLALWAQMPPLLAPQCDRVLFSQLLASQRCGWMEEPTLFFETWYVGHFLAAGLLPPRNAKFLHRHPEAAWQLAAEQFRQRCLAPVHLDCDLVGSAKARINLVSILGPARSGGTLLQSLLCRHFSYYGIPENHFLLHWLSCFGPDHRLRRDGAEVREALAAHQPQHPLLKAHDLQPRGLERAIRSDRSTTLLEGYFRVLQALVSPEAMAFSKAYGLVNVLERSCSQALAADVLFACLPQHQAVLMLRDPLELIAAHRHLLQAYPDAWAYANNSLATLCKVVLESWRVPLQAAPAGQLLLVSFRRLREEPAQELERVSGFLGLAPNPLLALEPLDLPSDHAFNKVHEHANAQLLARLPNELLYEEPWKQACLGGEDMAPAQPASLDEGWLAGERQALELLFAPLQALLGQLEQGDEELHAPLAQPQPTAELGLEPELVALVDQVVAGILRHGRTTVAP